MEIHTSAVIDTGAELGSGVTVGAFSVIGEDVQIGEGTRIGPHVVIHPHTRLGPRCRVHAGAVLGDDPQDLAFSGGASGVVIGAGCVFREGVTVHRGTREGTATQIGDRCFLMANSHVAHNCVIGDEVILANGVLLGGYVEIGDRAFLSGNCVVHQFCRVGRLALMSGLSAASKDVPPFCILLNNATNSLVGLNVVGLRRAGISATDRQQLKRAYRMLYHEGMNVGQALKDLSAAFPEGPAAELWQFVKASPRGCCGVDERASKA